MSIDTSKRINRSRNVNLPSKSFVPVPNQSICASVFGNWCSLEMSALRFSFSLCPAEPNSGSSRQPSALPSGESWAGGTCTDPFYPKEMSAWEPCLLHKSRQGYSDRLRRRQEGNVPSAEPFQDIPGLQGCLCSQGTLAFTPCLSGRTADDDKSSSR